MNIFWLLLLVHIIADFPLQTDFVFQLKQKKKWGVVLHGLIHFGLGAMILLPYWKSPDLWFGLLIISVSHVLIDKYKLNLGVSRSVMSFFFFWLDQLTHILVLVFVANFILINVKETVFFSFYKDFFSNTKLHIFLCAIFFVVFGSTFFIYYGRLIWENIYPSNGKLSVSFPTFRSRLVGYAERSCSILLIIIGGNFVFFVPGIYLARILYCWNRTQDRRYIVINFIISIFFILTFYFYYQS